MSIKILPARLANQIAAGEVVERPASVVKELVENSIDSGATRIDIDIEKGGAKLIRVRDNGCGIVKEELGLALSRHATSKIHTLDDLEAIVSLGFRGEALASISSVSRLTMTSRPVTQEQAWSAYAEGRDMSVKLQPTAHPVGTTVEVLDLFFNTPARRKFLRTEKTEFAHIDELLKRIALSRFDVAITLRHNGKIIRQYRTATTPLQMEKRLAAVCGNGFVRHMLRIELEHQGLTLKGWITTPEGARQQSDFQYCYVNGRMMRDKLINHAIRQSYETSLRPDQYAAYVLYIDLDPHQVDVNVHPAKHEVRFHQARLVHDFIYQALASALAQSQDLPAPQTNSAAFASYGERSTETQDTAEVSKSDLDEQCPEAVYQAIERTPVYPGRAMATRDDQVAELPVKGAAARDWQESKPTRGAANRATERHSDSPPSQREVRAYQELMQTPSSARTAAPPQPEVANRVQATPEVVVTQLGKAACIVAERYVLLTDKQQPVLLSLPRAEYYRTLGQLTPGEQGLKMQPLLVPLSLPLEANLLQVAQVAQPNLAQLGIELKPRGDKALLVMGVPAPLRQQNLQLLLPDLLSYLASTSQAEPSMNLSTISQWLAQRVAVVKTHYTLSEAVHLVAELENVWQGPLPLNDRQLVTPVDFAATIAQLTSS